MNEITKKVLKIILITIMIISICMWGASLLLSVWDYIDDKIFNQIVITVIIIFLFSFVPYCIIADDKKEDKSEKIFIVESAWGYEDEYSYRTEGMFSTKKLAEDYVELAKSKIKILENQLVVDDTANVETMESFEYWKKCFDLDNDIKSGIEFTITEFELDSMINLSNFDLPIKEEL